MIRIKGGRIIDPANGTDRIGDLYLQSGKIVPAEEAKSAVKVSVIEAQGKIVTPGLIDLHVHLREPGQEYKETIASGCAAAASGGFTSVVSMPNTRPCADNATIIQTILKQAEEAQGAHVFPMAAISKGLKGEELTEFADLLKAGAVAFTDDGRGVQSSAMMRSALEYAKNFDAVICAHCEDDGLVQGGCMHEGEWSTRLGLNGIPYVAESAMVARDIQLCEFVRSRYHVQHISTKESVELVRQAKRRGVGVTCEVTPHHLFLSDAAVSAYDSNFKVNPPLRSEEHIKALKRGLKDGAIDVIATDHAPHSDAEKMVEFDQAAFGMTGLETALPLCLNLVREGVLDWLTLISKFTLNPARLLGLSKGTLSIGADADVTIIDPDLEWTYERSAIRSKSHNSPWIGKTFTGRAVVTIVEGRVVHAI